MTNVDLYTEQSDKPNSITENVMDNRREHIFPQRNYKQTCEEEILRPS